MVSHFSLVQLFVTPWTRACQAPLSMGFSRHEYWNGLLFPSPGHLSDLELEPISLTSPALAGEFFTTELPGKPSNNNILRILYNGEYARDTDLYPEFFPT